MHAADQVSVERLRGAFEERFGSAPTHYARAPGRVNLIGEHVDYNGLPVLPIAVQREARLAFRARDDGLVRIHNLDDEFEDAEFEISPAIAPGGQGHWSNYCKAPANEMARRFAIWRGFDAILESTVPVAAGLSSSSALVNAVGLALAWVNDVSQEPLAMAELMADAERFTGTRGGGMDQAISLTAQAGCAGLVSFSPVRVRHVMIPEGWCFIVADTGVRAEKSGPAQAVYNRRREECEQALTEVANAAVEQGLASRPPRGYRELLSKLDHDRALALGERVLGGNLQRRFRHVVTEARRVRHAADLLISADLIAFGDLMDASHGSLHADYHVSSPELDEIVAIAREGGASGARLTGAGFGGCTVSLTERGTVDEVVEKLVSEYYEPRGLTKDLDDRLFVAIPSGGASVEAF